MSGDGTLIYANITYSKMKKNLSLALLLLIAPILALAGTLEEAMEEAASYFVKTAVRIESNQELHVTEVLNFASKNHDREGKRIETEIYFALEEQRPDFKLFLGETRNRPNEIHLSGTYEQTDDSVKVKFQIIKGNEILAQKEVSYDAKKRRKALVAVLDIEAKHLNLEQRKVFSDIFREALDNLQVFEMASSADLDKMDADQIQQSQQCTRDECATIIGEQLGVDRVISSSMRKVEEGFYFLSAKMIDIMDGSILSQGNVEHSGSLRQLRPALSDLAQKIAGVPKKIVAKKQQKPIEPREQPTPEISSSSSGSSWIWHTLAILTTAGGYLQASSAAESYNTLKDENRSLSTQYQASTDATEAASLKATWTANRTTMESHLGDLQTYNGVMAIGAVWELYLIFFGGSDNSVADYNSNQNGSPDIFVFTDPIRLKTTATLNWKF